MPLNSVGFITKIRITKGSITFDLKNPKETYRLQKTEKIKQMWIEIILISLAVLNTGLMVLTLILKTNEIETLMAQKHTLTGELTLLKKKLFELEHTF